MNKALAGLIKDRNTALTAFVEAVGSLFEAGQAYATAKDDIAEKTERINHILQGALNLRKIAQDLGADDVTDLMHHAAKLVLREAAGDVLDHIADAFPHIADAAAAEVEARPAALPDGHVREDGDIWDLGERRWRSAGGTFEDDVPTAPAGVTPPPAAVVAVPDD